MTSKLHSKALSLAREIERGHEWFTEENYRVLAEAVIDLVEQLETLREEVSRFADEFPGDSHNWRWVQNWAKETLAPSNPAKRPT